MSDYRSLSFWHDTLDEPIVQRAPLDGDTTADVCSSDATAVVAIHYRHLLVAAADDEASFGQVNFTGC